MTNCFERRVKDRRQGREEQRIRCERKCEPTRCSSSRRGRRPSQGKAGVGKRKDFVATFPISSATLGQGQNHQS